MFLPSFAECFKLRAMGENGKVEEILEGFWERNWKDFSDEFFKFSRKILRIIQEDCLSNLVKRSRRCFCQILKILRD